MVLINILETFAVFLIDVILALLIGLLIRWLLSDPNQKYKNPYFKGF